MEMLVKIKKCNVICFIILIVIILFTVNTIYNRHLARNEDQIEKCLPIMKSSSTINTKKIYSDFKFKADWIKDQNFWTDFFENRFNRQVAKQLRPPLKVFIIPHSHTDPGWLKTFKDYYESETRQIFNSMVEKLTELEDMTFVLSEISFLELWWEEATAIQQKNLKKLVKNGRLEIMTGGWVMTDEANVHLYAMLDQLIEGHQWVKTRFGVSPKIGWSIDPFGQGSTVPHLLAKSGLEAAIIQRIHYNWKEWLARHQYSDFFWKSLWNVKMDRDYTLLTHNMLFDMYTTSKSCGPNEDICAIFNFYKTDSDFQMKSHSVVYNENVKNYADELIRQYSKTASLSPHNVALVLLGDDFAFKSNEEFDQQYRNYKKIMNFVNENSENIYNNTTIKFGTPSEYFKEIIDRQKKIFPSLAGDFFPYADIFNSGVPAYWTGYYTTRPFYKLLSRTLEHNLRNAEILYNMVYNRARQSYMDFKHSKGIELKYGVLVKARRNLGLFQHHDSITGTSTASVMRDHLKILQKSIQSTLNLQKEIIEFLFQKSTEKQRNFIYPELEVPDSDELSKKKVIHISNENKEQKVLLFNSLSNNRMEVISLYVSDVKIKVVDFMGMELPFQINPVVENNKISDDYKELLVFVELQALSVTQITVKFDDKDTRKKAAEIVNSGGFEALSIENSKLKLTFNDDSGLLELLTIKSSKKLMKMEIHFGSYKSATSQSGAYLFKPNSENESLINKNSSALKVIALKGPLVSDLIVTYDDILSHSIRIYNTRTHLDYAVTIQNLLSIKEAETEVFMRIKTGIRNSKVSGQPEFFTDQNGFQWMPRRKVPHLEVEGNYYPITSSVFIQDNSMRLTLMTTHAKGVTSLRDGELEVMLDRRISGDDGRGLGEGVMDNVKMLHKFIFTLEFFENDDLITHDENYQVPSLFAHHLINSLNYPVNAFIVDVHFDGQLLSKVELFNYKFSCDINLVSLRLLADDDVQLLPSKSSLMTFHRLGCDCKLTNANFIDEICKNNRETHGVQFFNEIKIAQANDASLTGLKVNKRIRSIPRRSIQPMEIKSYHITYY